MKVQHPTIIHFEGFSFQDFQGYDNITIFIDYMEKGTLSDILEKEQHSLLPLDFDNTKRQMILVGISRGMMILHKNNVIHRDLKPENVLLDNDYKPLITDFGLSKIFTSQNSQSQSMATCGTYAYMAPEVIEGNRFSTKADVYAFGILMYEVVTGTSAMKSMTNNKPFNARKFMNSVVSGGRPTFQDEEIKPGLRRMIEQCWSNNPDERPTFSELYSKLSLADEEFYIDNDNNICEAVFKLEVEYEDNEDSLIPTNFCFDYVDFDELFLYIDEINEETNSSSNDEQLKSLKNEINELKTHAKKVENENTALKNDVSNIKNENKQLKNDISELKEIISNLKNEQQKIANMNICNQIEKPPEEELQDECIELAEKAKSEKLTSIELPPFLQKVPDSLLEGCDELKTVKIPFSVTEIGSRAFANCSSLSQVRIPSSVTKIGEYAFYRCSSLTKIVIPSSVTSIGPNAFWQCSSLKQITIPSSLTVLDFSVLSECSSLTQITIPSSVTEIGINAFEQCSSLSQITIPSSVSKIDPTFLANCFNIKEITVTRCGEERVKYSEDKFLLHKTDSSSDTFDTLLFAISNSKKVIIPSFIKTIGSLSGCSSMTQITIPSSVTKILQYAFNGCSSLTDIKIPPSVTEIGDYAFSGCSSLTRITIPSSVTEIGSYAFNKCQSLINISIPSSICLIRFSSFSYCTSLAEVTIPSSVTGNAENAFSSNTKVIKA